MSRIRAAAATLTGILALVGCAEGPAFGPPTPGVAAVVEMTTLLSFDPHTVRIRSGEVVEWRNKSAFGHTVVDDPAKKETLSGLPAGAEPFDSGAIPSGGVFRHTFIVPGTYRYYCDPHHGLGMLGIVVVDPAS